MAKKSPTTEVQIGNQTVPGSAAPSDRTFREAWQLEGDAITVDMEKARNIQRDRLRIERKPILEALDAQWFIAGEQADTAAQASVAAQKQALRDVTNHPAIDAATTPEALAALTVEALLE